MGSLLVIATVVAGLIALVKWRGFQAVRRYWLGWITKVEAVEELLKGLMNGNVSNWSEHYRTALDLCNRHGHASSPKGDSYNHHRATQALEALCQCILAIGTNDRHLFEVNALQYRRVRDELASVGIAEGTGRQRISPGYLEKGYRKWAIATLFLGLTTGLLYANNSDDIAPQQDTVASNSSAGDLIPLLPGANVSQALTPTVVVSGSCSGWDAWVDPSNEYLDSIEQISTDLMLADSVKAYKIDQVNTELKGLVPPEAAKDIHKIDLTYNATLVDYHRALNEGHFAVANGLEGNLNNLNARRNLAIEAANLKCVGRSMPVPSSLDEND